MEHKTINSYLILFLFILSIFTSINLSFTNDNIVVADSVVYENEYGRLEVEPATSYGILRQHQYYNMTWYYPDNTIDIAFCFNNSLSYGGIYYYNGEKYNKIVPNHVVYNSKHFYVLNNVNVVQDETIHGYWEYDVPIGSNGKWDMYAKLSSETIQEALASGHYIHLDPWWNSSYTYYKLYTINPAYISADLTNQPVLVNISDAIGDQCQADGDDIRFVRIDNLSEYPYQIDEWIDNQDRLVWVNITSISSTVPTQFLMYYSNPSAISNQSTSVWDSNYLAVYHLNTSTDSTCHDATGYHNSGTYQGSITDASFVIGNGQSMDGTGGNISVPSAARAGGPATYEMWVQEDNIASQHYIYRAYQDSNDYSGLTGSGATSNYEGFFYWNGAFDWDGVVAGRNTGVHHLAHAYDTGSSTLIKDTSNLFTDVGISGTHTYTLLYIGGSNVANPHFQGDMDEIRISNIKRSNASLKASYSNIINYDLFYTVSGAVSQGDIGLPLNFTANTSSCTNMLLAWKKGSNATHTYIRRSTTGYPSTISDGTLIYNSSGTSYLDTGLSSGTIYYYSAWSYNGTVNNYSTARATATNHTNPNNPTSVIARYNETSGGIDFSWTKGTNADNTILVYKNNSFPTSVSDGTVLYNSTGTSYSDTGFTSSRRYTLFSYSSSTNCLSSGVQAPWAALAINVYNENTSAPVTNWTVFISRQDGSSTYESLTNNNTLTIAIEDLPYGDNTYIFINATGYETKTFVMDLAINTFYTLNAYLSENTSTSQYIFTVVGPQTEYGYEPPISGATVSFKRYINSSVGYQNVSILITGATGTVSINLIPHENYLITVSKTGYNTEYKIFQPPTITYAEDRYHTIRLTVSSGTLPVIYDNFWDIVTITSNMSGPRYPQLGNITITYTDSNGSTVNTALSVYETYNGVITKKGNTYSQTGNSFTITYNNINTSRLHYFILYFNNTASFDFLGPLTQFIYPISIHTERTFIDIDERIRDVFGPSPFSDFSNYADIISIVLPLIILCSFGAFNTGIGIIGCSLSLGFMQGLYAMMFSNSFNALLALLCPLIFIIGILYIWTKSPGVDHL